MEKFFQLKANGTTAGREVVAGLTTFFAMAYIIAVNPTLLSQSGMEWGAVFLATIIASVTGTLVMGLVANVPYALAPGMGLNAFFVYTVCFTLGFTWQQALSMVFICGLLNIFITVTKIRKYIIKAIPRSLQNAIGGGIGIFVAYIGILNVGIVTFSSGVPALATLNQPSFWLFLIGLALTIILLVCNVKGAILIGIIVSSLTTKYRDLAIAVGFGVQLWMYVSPVVYPLSSLSESPRLRALMMLNPMTAPIEVFRMATLGTGTVSAGGLAYSVVFTLAALALGIILFSRIEKTFMDTV